MTLNDLIKSQVGKPVAEGITTRCGYPVCLYTANARDEVFSVVGSVKHMSGSWELYSWTDAGERGKCGESVYDLIAVPAAPVETWLNVNAIDGAYDAYHFHRKSNADLMSKNRIACIRLLDGKLAPEHSLPPVESGKARFFADVPEGQEPICFAESGEFRTPKNAEFFINDAGFFQQACCKWVDVSGNNRKMYTKVQPNKA